MGEISFQRVLGKSKAVFLCVRSYAQNGKGKSAIEWFMERYTLTTHKDSGITNDPNDWAEEVGNPRYVLDLLCSVVEVSVRSVEVVEGLPRVEFE
jgi:predicted helicase